MTDYLLRSHCLLNQEDQGGRVISNTPRLAACIRCVMHTINYLSVYREGPLFGEEGKKGNVFGCIRALSDPLSTLLIRQPKPLERQAQTGVCESVIWDE